jgi:HPr kinase/phosphorylase
MGPVTLHASCVALGDAGVLILGTSGRGKSALALQLLALGCVLVADDRVIVQGGVAGLRASCPPAITGLIEARGIGILTAAHQPSAQVVLAVDLDQTQTARLPEPLLTTINGCDIPLIGRNDAPYFPAAILQILKTGFSDR